MMDAGRMELQTRVDRYLADQMSAEESAAFETYMLEHPEILDDVAVARRLKLGLSTLRSQGELDALVKGGASATRNRFLALAASVLAAVGLTSWYLAERSPSAGALIATSISQLKSGVGPDAILGEVILARTRSGEQPEAVLTPSGLYQLRILADQTQGGGEFDIELARSFPDGDPIRLQGLRSDADGLVSLYFDAQAAGPGSYVLALEQRNSAGGRERLAEYRLEVK